MSVVEPGPAGGSLLARAGSILLRPGRTWAQLDGEWAAARELIAGYVAPLAAIPAVCGLIGMTVFGYSIAGIGFQANLATALIEAVVDFTLTLGCVLVGALAIDLLAPAFGGVRSWQQALKLSAYSATAVWVSGVFSLYPSVGLLAGALAGLYSLYTLFLGLPQLMRTPAENTLTYFAAVLGAVLVLLVSKSMLVGWAAELGGPLRAVGVG